MEDCARKHRRSRMGEWPAAFRGAEIRRDVGEEIWTGFLAPRVQQIREDILRFLEFRRE